MSKKILMVNEEKKESLNPILQSLKNDKNYEMILEASLDNITEKEVHENLENFMKESTIIQIAHRLSTLRNCDRIFVFDKSQIVEIGKYNELINKKGLFFELHKASEFQLN